MIAAILIAEGAFWALLLGGLALRYVVRARRLSTVVLNAVPLVDVVLITVVAVDLAQGGTPSRPHALAALYLGFTVAFGHSVIRAADRRFRHRFAGGGPAPSKPAKGSRAEVKALWVEWLRVVLAALIAGVGLGVMIAVEGHGIPAGLDEAARHPCWSTMLLTGLVVAIWFLAGPALAGRGRPDGVPSRR